MELQRAKVLQHDLIKSYVRLPDLQQKRMVEFAHSIGVPVATHEIYPGGVRRRRQHRAHGRDQPARLFAEDGDAAARLRGRDPAVRQERPDLLPDDLRRRRAKLFETSRPSRTIRGSSCIPSGFSRRSPRRGPPAIPAAAATAGGSGKMVMDVMRAGGARRRGHRHAERVNLHGELTAYTLAGMTPFEALKAATVNPARALGLDAGTIEAGKLADLVIVDGNPLENIANAHKVKRVIANGRVFELSDLVRGPAARTNSAEW